MTIHIYAKDYERGECSPDELPSEVGVAVASSVATLVWFLLPLLLFSRSLPPSSSTMSTSSADEVAVLVVSSRRRLFLAHNVVRVGLARVRKDGRHLFERSTGGLGEDEVGRYENHEVEDGKDNVGLVACSRKT